MEIRRYRAEDRIEPLIRRAVEDIESEYSTDEQKHLEEVIDDWYAVKDLRDQAKHPIFYVAEVKDNVVGFVHATVEDGTATLHRIYLDPEYQGRGIGSELYERAEKGIKKEADRVELEVLAENKKGARFYQKKGFQEQKNEKVELKGEEVWQKVLVKYF